jgi:hypothetical protein
MKKHGIMLLVMGILSIGAGSVPTLGDALVARKQAAAAELKSLAANRARWLGAPLESITFDKVLIAPTGDKRDYISVGRYWWPDPKKPDGLPYIRRDGQTNPEAEKNDIIKMNRMISAVRGLALLYHFTGDEEAAAHAVQMLKTFFTDPETGMNPHLTYAQAVPGREEGRPLGIIDTYVMIELTDCMALLKNARAMDAEDYRRLQQWFREYMNWLRSERMAAAFKQTRNNIDVAYHAQIAAYALFCGETDIAREHLTVLQNAVPGFIHQDGVLPWEIVRTRSWDYSVYALDILFTAVSMAQNMGMDWISEKTPHGQRIRSAVDYLCGYIGREAEWPFQQLNGPIAVDSLGGVLRKIHYFTGDAKYANAYRQLKKPRAAQTTALFYPAPE